MQTRNKVLDDFSQLMTNAMGVAQGAKDEAQTAMNSMIDRWLAERDFVTREEFEAVRTMAQKAREENEALKARIEALEATPSKSSALRRAGCWLWLACPANLPLGFSCGDVPGGVAPARALGAASPRVFQAR